MQIRSILVVSGVAAFSTRDVWDGYVQGLTEAGVNVIPYPTFSMLKILSPEMIGNDILGKAIDHRNAIDAVVFIDGLYFRERRQWVPKTLTDLGIPTILVATDDPYEPIEEAASSYSMQFTNEICCTTPRVGYMPTATSRPIPGPSGRKYDLVFIGTLFEDRWPLIQKLAIHCQENRIQFLVAGSLKVDAGELRDLDCVTLKSQIVGSEAKWRLYRSAKVVLNLFRQSERPAQSPSPRVFEVTALGQAALLTGPSREEVQRIFGDSVYHFDDDESMFAQLHTALHDDEDRMSRVEKAAQITSADHLYVNRARDLLAHCRELPREASESFPQQRQTAWIFGCGRSGSTWLNNMLGEIDGVNSWHEPMFGKAFQFLQSKPRELDRSQSFYHSRTLEIWLKAMRDAFEKIARERFPHASCNESLIVKDVNAAELCPFLQDVFPESNYILLVRDPYDVLDSFLDMQRPGGWNETYAGTTEPLEQTRISCNNIRDSFRLALNGYESCAPSRRFRIRFEDLLEETADQLMNCSDFLGVTLNRARAEEIAHKHVFSRMDCTGRLEHRRFGRAGIWRESQNFTPQVREIAENLLGGIRTHLGYLS